MQHQDGTGDDTTLCHERTLCPTRGGERARLLTAQCLGLLVVLGKVVIFGLLAHNTLSRRYQQQCTRTTCRHFLVSASALGMG
jgi:hypothetical protein